VRKGWGGGRGGEGTGGEGEGGGGHFFFKLFSL
jgi:hypothetical protein